MQEDKKTLRFLSDSVDITEKFAEDLAPLLQPGDVIAFLGDLGAGKTAFVRGLARGMGATDLVSSPTFVLMHIYEGRLPIYHFDAYRLAGPDDLYDIGAEEYIYGDGVACVEWSENVRAFLPQDCLQITITHRRTAEGADGRTLEIVGMGPRSQALVAQIKV